MKISMNLNDVQESQPVAAGRYDLIITNVEEVETRESKKPQLKISIAIEGHDSAPNVTHYCGLPSAGDDPKAADFKALLLKRFLTLFNIPFDADGFDLEDFVGATASAELELSEPNDNGDVYNRLRIPRMRGEGSEPARGSHKAPKH